MTLDTLNLALRTLLTFVLVSWSSIALSASETPRASFYISPAGSDSNSGRRAGEPFRTFEHAFRKLLAGDELILLDGVYSESAGTGHIGYVDANTVDASTTKVGGRKSAQIPSGLSATRPTYVRALNPGKVKIIGELFVGRSFRKDSHIVIRGITFEGGGTLYNANHITVRECGFHGPFGIGTNDHKQGNDYNLIEDVWIWASRERIIASNYRSRYNVWRRVLVRGDGCGTQECLGSQNPNVGITVYDSSDISLQNVMVVDRILQPTDSPYSDFAVAQHTPGSHLFGRNEWLGTISLKAPDTGYYMEPDTARSIPLFASLTPSPGTPPTWDSIWREPEPTIYWRTLPSGRSAVTGSG